MSADAGTRTGTGARLFTPGPVLLDERVRAAQSSPDMCHREDDFLQLLAGVRTKLVSVCDGDERHSAVVLSGSGTAAVEAVLSSSVPDDGGVLVLTNGHYGERLVQLADAYGIRRAVLDVGWAAGFDVREVDRALRDHPRLTHVAMVHHETSTGRVNPLADIAGTVAAAGRDLVVDAVSSIGAERLSMRTQPISWCAGSSAKCLEGVAGIGFVCADRAAVRRLAAVRPRNVSLDLRRHFRAQAELGVPAFTPAVQAVAALDVALELLIAEGVEARGRRYRALTARLRRGLDALGLRILVPEPDRSTMLTAVGLPPGVDYRTLHDEARRAGYALYAAQDALAGSHFRLATMGRLTADDVDGLLAVLAGVVRQARPVPSLSAPPGEPR